MTKTDAENTPSDALTAWWKAFFTRDAKAFAEGFAQNVVLEASALRKPVEGRDRVRQMVWSAAEIYESLVFTDQASSGQRISVEWWLRRSAVSSYAALRSWSPTRRARSTMPWSNIVP
jgi:hypothetical protein